MPTTATETTGGPRTGLRVLLLALVAAAAFLAHARSLGHGFLDWDDRGFLLTHDRWHGLSAAHLEWMFTTLHVGHYQPLTWMSFAVNHALGGLDPFGYHLGNVLLHALNAVLVALVIERLLGLRTGASTTPGAARARLLAAAVGALLFAVHPLRVESVAWITERRDVLSSAFLLAALLAWLRGTGRDPAPGWNRARVAAVALFLLSLFAKAWGLTFFAVLLVLDAGVLGRLGGGPGRWCGADVRRVWTEKIPFLLLAIPFAVVAPFAQDHAGVLADTDEMPLPARLATAAWGLVFYVRKSLLPVDLTPLVERPADLDPFAGRFVLAVLLALGAIAVLYALRRRAPALVAAFAVYALVLAPVLGLVQSGPQLAADRYAYLATIPFCALAAAGLAALHGAGVGRFRAALAAGLVAAAALGVLARHQTGHWESDRSLWTQALRVDPAARRAAVNLGVVHLKDGDPAAAEDLFRRALDSDPGYVRARLRLATALRRQGRDAEARAAVARAVTDAPDDPEARRGAAFERLIGGDAAGALGDFDALTAADARDAAAHRGAGLALARLGRLDPARERLARAVALDGGAPESLDALATVEGLAGRPQAAGALLEGRLREEPSAAHAWLTLGKLRLADGDAEGALAAFRTAVRLGPHDADAHANLGLLLLRRGARDEAIARLAEAVRLAPTNAAYAEALKAARKPR